MLTKTIARKTLGIKDHRIVRVAHDENGISIHLARCMRRRLPREGTHLPWTV